MLCAAVQAQIHYPMLDMRGIPHFLDKLAGEQQGALSHVLCASCVEPAGTLSS